MKALIENLGMNTLVAMSLMAFAAVAWIVAMAMSALSRSPQPKAGFRRSDVTAIAVSIVFALTVGYAMSAATKKHEPKPGDGGAKHASVSRGTCASLRVGMKAQEVKAKLGEPDEIRSEEDVRGPEAQAWVYQASRCSVHVLAGKVDFVD